MQPSSRRVCGGIRARRSARSPDSGLLSRFWGRRITRHPPCCPGALLIVSYRPLDVMSVPRERAALLFAATLSCAVYGYFSPSLWTCPRPIQSYRKGNLTSIDSQDIRGLSRLRRLCTRRQRRSIAAPIHLIGPKSITSPRVIAGVVVTKTMQTGAGLAILSSRIQDRELSAPCGSPASSAPGRHRCLFMSSVCAVSHRSLKTRFCRG